MTDYRAVPVEPDEEMVQAGVKAAQSAEQTCVSWPEMAYFTYRAMLAAAPGLSASPALAGDMVERVAGIIRELKVTDYDSAADIPRAVIAAMQPGWRDMESGTDAIWSELSGHVRSVVAESPNAFGELLLAWAFPGEGRGCYSNFDLRDGFAPIPVTDDIFRGMWDRNANDEDRAEWWPNIRAFRHERLSITIAWHWDGDGHLYVDVPGIGAASNSDIKDANYWTEAQPLPAPPGVGG